MRNLSSATVPNLANRRWALLALWPWSLNPRRILVDSEFCAKDVADLPDRRLTTYCLADRVHQVFARTAGFCNLFERLPDRATIALAFHLAHALDLQLLKRRIDF